MIFRVFFSFSLVLWTFIIDRWLLMVGLLAFCLILLLLHHTRGVVFARSIKLLAWLYIPIMLFHGLFTPGVYVQHPFYMPFTIEGLEYALHLSLHMTVMFFAAMLFIRLLLFTEWLYCLSYFPRLWLWLLPYLLLLKQLRMLMTELLFQQRMNWLTMERKWLILPQIIVQSIRLLMMQSKTEAKALWAEWENRVLVIDGDRLSMFSLKGNDMIYGVLLGMGWVLLWLM